MKIKIIAGTMVALSFSLMSCSDFLTEDPRGKLTPENFFSTQDELNMSIYALYQKVNLSQVYTNMQLPQWQGDDITTNPGSNKQPAAEMDSQSRIPICPHLFTSAQSLYVGQTQGCGYRPRNGIEQRSLVSDSESI